MSADLLIVGAGVGGLTLGVGLAQHGVSVSIYEREGDGVESGAGLLLAPNATGILEKLGLLPEALKLGHTTAHWLILNQSGAVLRDIEFDGQAYPALSIHRADLLKLLRSQLSAGCLQGGANLRTIRDSGQGVELEMADGSLALGKALVGADGIRSTVRRHLFGDLPLRYRGYVGWRGVAAFIPDGYESNQLSETWGPGGRFGIAPIGNGRTYWYASANEKEDWDDPVADRQANLLQRFARWHEPVSKLIAATANEEILVSRIYDVPELDAWSRGNIALLGDAAHAMTPNLGQGACLAMEDAWALGSILPDHAEVETSFRKYERARRKRVCLIQQQSRAMGWIVQAENPIAVAAREWITPRVPESVLKFGMSRLFDNGSHGRP